MPWPLFLLVISVCLIQDIQSAPESNAFGNKADSGSDDQQNLCEKCQVLEVPNLLEKYAVVTLEKTCLKDRAHQDICSLIQGREAEFVDTLTDFENDAEEKELCSNLSVCDPSQNDWIWKQRPLSTCEQCRWTILGFTDEARHGRQQYHTKKNADLLKEVCRDTFTRKYFSDFCALIEGREFEVVKSAFDCTGVEFKDDESQINCMAKACESFVESCKDDKFPWPNEK
ncbi:hypothetical protein Ddc_17010 [Ditylenchus destructor]|nr:hypothetical protein Ddc_17010 [Ditylenchus destructor]